MTPSTAEQLARYLNDRDQQHAAAVSRTLAAMTKREQRLVREAAVMGYVRGLMAGRAGDSDMPPDSAVLSEVIDACLAMPELYPIINAVGSSGNTT